VSGDRTGIVIGATGGLGAACARVLADACDRLLVSGRREQALSELAGELGPHAVAVAADVTEEAGREAIAGAVRGPIAWVVLAHGSPLRKPFPDLDEREIAAAFDTNLVAPALLVRRLLDLPWEPDAAIVVIGSISASRSLPRRAVYSASKAGLEHLARSLAAELAPRQIRVNVVAPGVVATPFLGEDVAALDDWVRERVPLGRLGDADEVAEVVRFAALDAPAYVTGARIVVDGGAEARA
jgi:NAD(P)-dependent dehydrogenase (short-subunit alcohol dehydrogenase family)